MITLETMSFSDFLNKKYFEMQSANNRRMTVEEFGKLFDASKSLMNLWMNGKRTPGPEYKERIIQYFGEEAIIAFGEDPDFYRLKKNWDFLTPEKRREMAEESEHHALKRNIKRAHKERRPA
jgi:transcriptional regulator with XRE-family HTH domain